MLNYTEVEKILKSNNIKPAIVNNEKLVFGSLEFKFNLSIEDKYDIKKSFFENQNPTFYIPLIATNDTLSSDNNYYLKVNESGFNITYIGILHRKEIYAKYTTKALDILKSIVLDNEYFISKYDILQYDIERMKKAPTFYRNANVLIKPDRKILIDDTFCFKLTCNRQVLSKTIFDKIVNKKFMIDIMCTMTYMNKKYPELKLVYDGKLLCIVDLYKMEILYNLSNSYTEIITLLYN